MIAEFWSALVALLSPPHGHHRRTCRCKSRPSAAFPGTRWTCPECHLNYVAEIYDGRVHWLIHYRAPSVRILARSN